MVKLQLMLSQKHPDLIRFCTLMHATNFTSFIRQGDIDPMSTGVVGIALATGEKPSWIVLMVSLWFEV